MSQVSQPPRESRLLREADPTFVHNLKQKMIIDPAASGATPMAVFCKDVEAITEFNMKYKNVYKYKLLGVYTHWLLNPSLQRNTLQSVLQNRDGRSLCWPFRRRGTQASTASQPQFILCSQSNYPTETW